MGKGWGSGPSGLGRPTGRAPRPARGPASASTRCLRVWIGTARPPLTPISRCSRLLPALRSGNIGNQIRGPSTHQPRVIPGYTGDVKTAISLPDATYEQPSRPAAELGISRSEFFARAARRYLDELASQSLTRQINEALQASDDDSNAAAAAAGRGYLASQDDW